jgi:hypothetical protein
VAFQFCGAWHALSCRRDFEHSFAFAQRMAPDNCWLFLPRARRNGGGGSAEGGSAEHN